jgi:hypothetical protein
MSQIGHSRGRPFSGGGGGRTASMSARSAISPVSGSAEFVGLMSQQWLQRTFASTRYQRVSALSACEVPNCLRNWHANIFRRAEAAIRLHTIGD